jgi:hypothetical protein
MGDPGAKSVCVQFGDLRDAGDVARIRDAKQEGRDKASAILGVIDTIDAPDCGPHRMLEYADDR